MLFIDAYVSRVARIGTFGAAEASATTGRHRECRGIRNNEN
jgi:hypothetical protein